MTATIFKQPNSQAVILKVYDDILTRWPIDYQLFTLPTRHGSTAVIACGDPSAPPLILLHGSTSNSAMWIGDAPIYARQFRVYAVDIPGEPGKSEAVRADLTGPDAAEWLEDVCEGLGISQVSLVGLSLGGWHALKFAVTHPQRVHRMVLISTAGVAPQKPSFLLRVFPLMFLGKWGFKRISNIIYSGAEIPQEALEYTHLIAQNFNPRLETIPVFSDEQLGKLTMPVLLVMGAKDALLPAQATVQRLQALLPHLTTRLLPDMGHAIINQAGSILGFLTQ